MLSYRAAGKFVTDLLRKSKTQEKKMKKKALQHFSKDYLEHCAKMSNEERLEYLENFRLMVGEVLTAPENEAKSKLISLKMPVALLSQLKLRAQMEGMPYQSLLKKFIVQGLA